MLSPPADESLTSKGGKEGKPSLGSRAEPPQSLRLRLTGQPSSGGKEPVQRRRASIPTPLCSHLATDGDVEAPCSSPGRRLTVSKMPGLQLGFCSEPQKLLPPGTEKIHLWLVLYSRGRRQPVEARQAVGLPDSHLILPKSSRSQRGLEACSALYWLSSRAHSYSGDPQISADSR